MAAEPSRLMKFARDTIPGFGALGSLFSPPKEPTVKQLQQPQALVDPSRLVAGWNLQPYNPSWLVTRKGLVIYDMMKRDEQVKAALKFKKSSVLAAGWEVVSPPEMEEDWEVTLFVRDALTRINGGWNATLYNVLSALEYGFSVGEKIYKEVEDGEWKGKLQLDRIQSLKPHFLDFVADEFGQLQGIRQQMTNAAGSGPTRLLAPAKFVYYTHEFEFGNFYGSSDLEAAYRPWWVKDNAYKWLAVALERYGMPPLFAMYDPQAYQGAQIEELKKVVRGIQNATLGVLPRAHADALEFWSQQLGSQSSGIFLTALQRFDEHIARALLVPSMLGVSSDEGKTGSLARSQEHAESFLRIIQQIQQNMSTMVVNAQIIPQLCDLNWETLDAYPQFRFLPFSDEKRLEVMNTWSELVSGKVVGRVEDDEVHIRKVLGFPENENVKLEPLPGDAELEAKKEGGFFEKPEMPFGGGKGKPGAPKPKGKKILDEDQTAEMRQFAEENNAVWIETEEGAVAVDAFAWEESKHPRHAAGSSEGGRFDRKGSTGLGDALLGRVESDVVKHIDADSMWQEIDSIVGQLDYLTPDQREAASHHTILNLGRDFPDYIQRHKARYERFGPRVEMVNGRPRYVRDHAAWDESKHPRHPSGDSRGGEFSPSLRGQVADAFGLHHSEIPLDISLDDVNKMYVKRIGDLYSITQRGKDIVFASYLDQKGADSALARAKALAARGYAWDESKHPRHPAGDAKGGEFAPKEEPPGVLQRYSPMVSYKDDLVQPDIASKIRSMDSELGRIWENPNRRPEDNVYLDMKKGSPNLTISFGGRVYDAFKPRAGVDDDDHPNLILAKFDQYGDRVKAVAQRHFPGAKIEISAQEKYYMGLDIKLPAARVITGELKLNQQLDFNPDAHPRHPRGTTQGGEFAPKVDSREKQTEGLKEYLETMTEFKQKHRQNDLKFKSVEEYVLKNGEAFPEVFTELPKGVRKGKPKFCFMNAYHAAEDNPDLTYVEGFATANGLPLAHAWVVDKKGRVIDPTWTPNKLTDKDTAYYGVRMSLPFVHKTIFARGKYGIIYNEEQGYPLLSGKAKAYAEDENAIIPLIPHDGGEQTRYEYYSPVDVPLTDEDMLLLSQEYATYDAGEGEDGVWRTINGRKIFIRKGESVQEAFQRVRAAANAEEARLRAIMDLPPEAYPKTNAAPSMIQTKGGVDTLQQYMRADGTLTPERKALHDAIVAQHLAGHSPQKNPITHFMGGGGASGKSVMQAMLTLPQDRVHVDVDIIRTKLPEWGAELKAAAEEGRKPHYLLGSYTHEESSLISKRIIGEAVRRDYHLMVDGAGDTSIDKVAQNIKQYTAEGKRKAIVDYVTVDYDTAYARMRARGDQIGRYIPAAHLREVHSEVARVFPEGVRRGLYPEFTLWDTSDSKPLGGGKFSPPKKVASGKGKDMTIHDQSAYDKFLERGKGIAPREGEI